MIKSCAICKNVCFSPSSPGWSEYTPGGDASVSCRYVHLPDFDEPDFFVRLREIADICDYFEADDPEQSEP